MKFAILAVLGGTLVCVPICGAQDRTAGQAAHSRESRQGKELAGFGRGSCGIEEQDYCS
jgi:hypothetical protein